jgi:hypothetical protein
MDRLASTVTLIGKSSIFSGLDNTLQSVSPDLVGAGMVPQRPADLSGVNGSLNDGPVASPTKRTSGNLWLAVATARAVPKEVSNVASTDLPVAATDASFFRKAAADEAAEPAPLQADVPVCATAGFPGGLPGWPT